MPRLLVIYAHWCPVCNMMMPLVEEIEAEYAEKIQVIWLDVEEHPEAYEKYEIQMVPTFIVMREECEIARMSGMIGEQILRERIPLD